jgi:hypothetical protein
MSIQTQQPLPEEPLTKGERLRRVVLVCGYFMRNLGYYRAGFRDNAAGKKELKGKGINFWRHVSSNFLDAAVMEWCKLFGDKNGKHHWSKIVSDQAMFEAELLRHLGLDSDEFAKYIEGIRRYRDKFAAHLDSDRVMHIPDFEIAKAAVEFYHKWILQKEIQSLEQLEGLLTDLGRCYQDATDEANRIYERAASE